MNGRLVSPHRLLRTIRALTISVFAMLMLSPIQLGAQSTERRVTFTKDVAPIFQKNCLTCHRTGAMAPMALETYQDVRPWVRAIRAQVMSRAMPPWPIDRTIGIQSFKNDRSLSDDEVQVIVDWVDAGAPMGNPKDMPPPLPRVDYTKFWRYEENFGRPPDIVVESPRYKVSGSGADNWPALVTDIKGLSEERWIKAAEFRPATLDSLRVFHHANPSIGQPTQGGEMNGALRQVQGMEGTIYADDTGVPLRPGDVVEWGMHLFAVDKDVEAVMQIGLWLYPKGQKPKYAIEGSQEFNSSQFTGHGFDATPNLGFGPNIKGTSRGDTPGLSADPQISRQGDLLIPPNSMATYRGVYVMPKPARLESLRAHMHLRGVYQILEAIYPDGRWEVINKLHNNHRWQTEFLYTADAMPLLPKGTVLIVTSVYDNTTGNPNNPDPNQWVVRGERTVDEMAHMRANVIYFDDEAEFNRLVQERAASRRRQLSTQTSGPPSKRTISR